jgi:hypothetical protein
MFAPQSGHSFVAGMILVVLKRVSSVTLALAARLDKARIDSYR